MIFFATCPKGVEPLLLTEIQQIGAEQAKATVAGVSFSGDINLAYRVCLWSRLANQVFLQLAELPIEDYDSLYHAMGQIEWSEHFTVKQSFAIDVIGRIEKIHNPIFAAQKAKDAIVDQFRNHCGARPNSDPQNPDIRLQCLIKRHRLIVSLNLSGDSLHRRGYRQGAGEAPLKENLAAALLLRAGWPQIAAEGGSFLDPMCGSGTLPIEAALIAGDIAPGIFRTRFGFYAWQQFKREDWLSIFQEARQRRDEGLKKIPMIIGYDADVKVINAAIDNAETAGLQGIVHFERRDLTYCQPPKKAKPGLLLVNPPYGERLGEIEPLAFTYQHLGDLLRESFAGWQASVFTGNEDLAKRLRLAPDKSYALANGAIPCRLFNYVIHAERLPAKEKPIPVYEKPALPEEAKMFVNRLEKNLKHLKKWAKREGVSCYRLYDADLPEYAVAIDFYEDNYAHVQEYAPPKTIDPLKAEQRLSHVIAALPEILQIPLQHVFLKTRQKQKGKNQYQKLATQGEFIEVHEGAAKFLVNFVDYLDTGIFLDSRLIRQWLFNHVSGKRFLNLFAYTGTATVLAALGGAAMTMTVDMSNVYLMWAKRNLALNGIGSRKHNFIQADCLQWMAEEKNKYELILLDPPSFSNSKRMQETLDVQRDHVELIEAAAKLLTKDGQLLFVTNKQKFHLDQEALSNDLLVSEITNKTVSEDFKRNQGGHKAYLINYRR